MSDMLDRYERLLDKWLEADEAVANNQSYEIDGRKLTRADADAITEKIKFYQRRIARTQRGGMRVTRGVASE